MTIMFDQQYVLLIDNDNVLEVNGLRNAVTDAFINNATISATLKDIAGVAIAGQTWPLTLPYVTDSEGCYRALLANTLAVSNGKPYTLQITAAGSGLKASYSVIITAQTRRNQ
jgi:hypothetical protein